MNSFDKRGAQSRKVLKSIPCKIFASSLFLAGLISCAGAFNILILFPTCAKSHQQPALSLTEALVAKGHTVFLASPNDLPELESSNFTHVDFSWMYQYAASLAQDHPIPAKHLTVWEFIPFFQNLIGPVTQRMFESDTFKRFCKRVKEQRLKFDVIIIETAWVPFGAATSHILAPNTPLISLDTYSGGDTFVGDFIGNIAHLSYTPSFYFSYTDKMSLWERIDNWVTHKYVIWRLGQIIEHFAESLYRDTYGPGGESLVAGSWANVSVAITSSSFLYFYPRPLPPNTIEVGPLHIKPPERLPKILQEWLDGATKGVIYFSLGSNMKSEFLQDTVLSNFLRIFKELSEGYRVLWKWESDDQMPGKPDNVFLQKWLPQQSVLAHPKVKLFITQGGCQSFQETIHYGVPTVGIPWFGDQESNVAKMVDAGIGARLMPSELDSYERVKLAIHTVLFDEGYSSRMQRLTDISRDFTSTSRDEAVFWVEHVARHGGAPHLRPITADSSYFEFFCLDILTVFLSLSALSLYVLFIILRYLSSRIIQSFSAKQKIS